MKDKIQMDICLFGEDRPSAHLAFTHQTFRPYNTCLSSLKVSGGPFVTCFYFTAFIPQHHVPCVSHNSSLYLRGDHLLYLPS